MDPEEKRRRLEWAVGRLPPSCRTAAIMHYLTGLSPEEVDRVWTLVKGEARRQLDEAEALLPDLMKVKPPAEPVPVPARGFRYLLDPEAQVGGRLDPQPCVACAEERPGFDVVVYQPDKYYWDRHYVCEPCLHTGRLAERGLRMNQGESGTLAGQLAAMHRDLSSAELGALGRERTREVECCTPRPRLFQSFLWPAHCGDFYGFVKQVSKADLVQLAPDGDGLVFFARYVRPADLIDGVEWHWEEGFAPEGFLHAYLWRCLHCGEHLITCDHE